MNSLLGTGALWSLAVILLVPLVIITASEIEERLRQADSPLRAPLRTIRNWVLPLFAAWALLGPVLRTDEDVWYRRAVTTGLILAVAVTAWQMLRVIGEGIQLRPGGQGRRPVPRLVLAFPRIAVILTAAALIISGVWGVDLSAALTALGVTSLVVSFALQDTLSGLASGVLLLSDRPFKTGDWITAGETAGGIEGVVVDINWRSSQIRDRNGDTIVVPNSQLANASVVNHSTPTPLHRVVVSLQVAFANPPTLAKDMLLDAARGVPGVLSEPPPDVQVITIDDPLMGYDVHMWVDDFGLVPRVKSDFGALVWYQSRRHNVPLPSPAQDLFIHDPIAEAKAAEPTLAELRESLLGSPLLENLPEADLDRLAHSSRPVRYRAGELMFDSESEVRDLLLVVAGSGRLVLLDPGFEQEVINEVGPGDLVGLLDSRHSENQVVALRAVTDCDVLVVPEEVMGEVGSRNADVAAALNRLLALRQRRIARLVQRRSMALGAAAHQDADA
jgi:small-conductance mechanosensitive channel